MCFPEENQYDLFKSNGLPLMIQVLTESQNEELNKAATFVLHNCKKISKFTITLKKYQPNFMQENYICFDEPSPFSSQALLTFEKQII